MAAKSDFVSLGNLLRMLRSGGVRPAALGLAGYRTLGLFAITGVLGAELVLKRKWDGGRDPTISSRQMQRWCRAMCRLFGVEVSVSGQVPVGSGGTGAPGAGVLLMCNHRSYSDIPVVGSLLPIVFVSRAELLNWPVIGWGGTLVGTIFVERDRPESRRWVQEQVRERLRQGLSVLNYPEGTTHQGEGMLPFKPGLFRVAAGQDITLVPVTLKYPAAAGLEWTGGATFLDHLIEKAAKPWLEVEVHFGEPMQCGEHPEADALLRLVRAQMLAALDVPPTPDQA